MNEVADLIQRAVESALAGKSTGAGGKRRLTLTATPSDLLAMLSYADATGERDLAPSAAGELRERVWSIEKRLHGLIRSTLETHYGPGEDGWWRKGIPQEIRKKCQHRREDDTGEPGDPFSYADLIDLKQIVEADWSVFESCFAPAHACFENKGAWKSGLQKLNEIRNRLMHAARDYEPDDVDRKHIERFEHALRAITNVSSM